MALFGSSGIRMPFDKGMLDTISNVSRHLCNAGESVLIGMDTRTTSHIVKNTVVSNMLACGVDVADAKIVPTPVIGVGARNHTYGVMITASHNPEEYNGIKIFNSDGSSILLAQQRVLESRIADDTAQFCEWNRLGNYFQSNVLQEYLAYISAHIDISTKNFKVLLDCGNGAGCYATPTLLDNKQVQTIGINCNPSGWFVRGSEPSSQTLQHIPAMISACNLAGGIAHDGDADRIVTFDDKGRIISGDHLIRLMIDHQNVSRVVINHDTSMMIDECVRVRRVPVGDAYVSEGLTKWGELGCEPSGVFIFPGISLCPDGIYAAGKFCEMLADGALSKKIDRMPHYTMIRKSIVCENPHEIMRKLGCDTPTDGIRVEEPGGWYMIRASGTEPKLRITAEGKTEQLADTLYKKGAAVIKCAE